jgi:hypothetical protein
VPFTQNNNNTCSIRNTSFTSYQKLPKASICDEVRILLKNIIYQENGQR